jgi:UDP-2,3-diacylglucosamine pyrophosphatase LpxH
MKKLVIAHLSDLHFGAHNPTMLLRIKEYLSSEKPNICIISGDIAEHPKTAHYIQAYNYFLKLKSECIKDIKNIKTPIIFVPGNHDCRFYGNFGCKGITNLPYIRFSKKYKLATHYFLEKYNTTIFLFDSNPFLFGFARGNVGYIQRRSFRKLYNNLLDKHRKEFEKSFKIAVLHHHPLPIPYSSKLETFMILVDAGEFVRTLTEAQIDLVLHGHKHDEAQSYVNLGTVASGRRDLCFLACGSTSKKQEQGYHLNVITIYPEDRWVECNNVRCEPGECFVPSESFLLPSTEGFIKKRYTQSEKENAYSVERDRRKVIIEPEGDIQYEFIIKNLKVTNPANFRGITPFEFTVTQGHIVGEDIDFQEGDITTDLVKFEKDDDQYTRSIKVIFPTDSKYYRKNITYTIKCFLLNNVNLTHDQVMVVYPKARKSGHQIAFPIQRPVESFECFIKLPLQKCIEQQPWIQVTSKKQEIKNIILSNFYNRSLNYDQSSGSIYFHAHKPSIDFDYAIQWRIPVLEENDFEDRWVGRIAAAKKKLLDCRESDLGKKVDDLMEATSALVKRRLEIDEEEQIDVSLMVYDGSQQMAKLVSVSANDQDNINFELSIGDGVAGRAYKFNKAQVYRKRRAKLASPRSKIYIPRPDRHHQVLFSVPMRHLMDDRLKFGVLNVGSFKLGSELVPLNKDIPGYRETMIKICNYFVIPKLSRLIRIDLKN